MLLNKYPSTRSNYSIHTFTTTTSIPKIKYCFYHYLRIRSQTGQMRFKMERRVAGLPSKSQRQVAAFACFVVIFLPTITLMVMSLKRAVEVHKALPLFDKSHAYQTHLKSGVFLNAVMVSPPRRTWVSAWKSMISISFRVDCANWDCADSWLLGIYRRYICHEDISYPVTCLLPKVGSEVITPEHWVSHNSCGARYGFCIRKHLHPTISRKLQQHTRSPSLFRSNC